MDKEHIEEIISEQKAFFMSGRTLDVSFRIKALKRLYTVLRKHEDLIAAALKKDLGKSPAEAYMCETGLALSEIRHMINHVNSYAAEKRVRTPLSQYVSRSFKKPVPYGQVLIMSPWNYPVLLAIEPLADALAAGNTAVLKPGSYAEHSSALLEKLIKEIFPEKYVAVVTGGRNENSALLECGFDYIFFTGSKTVGLEVLAKAAKRLTPVTLELGGKSPCIVDSSANIRLAARRIVFGKFLNSGQTCVAPDYIYCDISIKKRLIEEIKKEIHKQYGSAPLENENYGRIINKKHFDRLSSLIGSSMSHGAYLVYGGICDREKLKIEPSVFDNVTWDTPVMGEEIFGPILPVLSYTDIKEAVREISKRARPLALYIFSSDKKHIEYVKNHVQFGGGCINDTVIHLATSWMGFGGVGESGMGSYHGKTGFDTFSHYKSIADKKTFIDIPARYQPYSEIKYKMLKAFLK